MNVAAGQISGNFNDLNSYYQITSNTDGKNITLRKEYPNMSMVCYEGRFVGDRRRIEDNFGFQPGVAVDSFFLDLA